MYSTGLQAVSQTIGIPSFMRAVTQTRHDLIYR
jgi:hypothetical protein